MTTTTILEKTVVLGNRTAATITRMLIKASDCPDLDTGMRVAAGMAHTELFLNAADGVQYGVIWVALELAKDARFALDGETASALESARRELTAA